MQNYNFQNWLKATSFKTNPFGPNLFEHDCLRLKTSHNPDQDWEKIRSPIPSIIIGEHVTDRKAVALQLLSEWQKPNELVSFPIFATLPYLDRGSTVEHNVDLQLFQSLGYATAQAWFDLTKDNPDAYLELSAIEQRLLTELMIWQAGSLEAALIKLEPPNTSRQNKQEIIQRRVLRRAIRSQSARVGIIRQLSITKIIGWMSLRPPVWKPQYDDFIQPNFIRQRMTKTYLILTYWTETRPADQAIIDTLFHYLGQLVTNGIFVKLLIPSVYCQAMEDDYKIELRWSDDKLKQILEARLRFADSSSPTIPVTFDDLFDSGYKPPKWSTLYYQQELIQRANGSLGCMLTLGNLAIRKHIELSGDDPPAALSEKAWDAALAAFHAT